MTTLELEVTQSLDGCTVKNLLKRELGLSTTLINRLKRTPSGLTVNGQRAFTNAVLHTGDHLLVDLNSAEQATKIEPLALPLDILYEDECLLVVNKSAPLACIPSSLSPGEPTLAAGLLHYLGPGASVHLVNRLDRGTSGVLVAAKNAHVHELLRRQLHTGAFQRIYLAVCIGAPHPMSGCIDLPINRAPGSAIQRMVDSAGKPAVTNYRTLRCSGGFSLVELTPQTGRTHQLRVHMAAIGCPLAGDWLYGTEDKTLIARPALHAARLVLTHPLKHTALTLEVELPTDIRKLTERDNHGSIDISGLGMEHNLLP